MSFRFEVILDNLPALGKAFLITLELSFLGILFGTILGITLGFLTISRSNALRYFAKSFTEIFLSIPLLVLIIWIYFTLPYINNSFSLSGFNASLIAISFSLSAFVSEIIRTGIRSIPKGEIEVALTCGMKKKQIVWFIIIPQVIKQIWPALMGQYITTYKFSTLASIVAVNELLHTGSLIISQTYRPLEIYTTIAVLFIITILPLNLLLHRIENFEMKDGIKSL